MFMKDGTFGNVKANLSYEEMVELIKKLKEGDMVKIREDLVDDCLYYVERTNSFSDHYDSRECSIEKGCLYTVRLNDTFDKSLELEEEDYWISYNMINIDWLVENKKSVEEPKQEVAIVGDLAEDKPVEIETVEIDQTEEDFFQRAKELNEIAHEELEVAINQLNEAISKVKAINKEIVVIDRRGCTLCNLNSIEIAEDNSRNIALRVRA